MGVWIRSQNKQRLSYCVDFYLQEKLTESYAVIGCSKNSNEHIIGTYSTKEKVFKVLNMIQQCIENSNMYSNIHYQCDICGKKRLIKGVFNNVFKMPQDEEVYTND